MPPSSYLSLPLLSSHSYHISFTPTLLFVHYHYTARIQISCPPSLYLLMMMACLVFPDNRVSIWFWYIMIPMLRNDFMLHIKLINSVTKSYNFVKAVRKQIFFFGVKCSTIFPLYYKIRCKRLIWDVKTRVRVLFHSMWFSMATFLKPYKMGLQKVANSLYMYVLWPYKQLSGWIFYTLFVINNMPI